MASANTYDNTDGQGSAVGIREHLLDVISKLDPEENPVFSMAKKVKAKQAFVEWQIDNLGVPSFNGIEEGVDVVSYNNKHENLARVGSYCQKFRRDWKVTTELEQSVVAGIKSMVAEAQVKCMKEMKRDIEAAICSDQEMDSGSSNGIRLLRGLGKYIQTSAQSVNPIPEAYRSPSGHINTTATSSFGVDDIDGVLQSLYNTVGMPQKNFTLVCGSALKSAISGLQKNMGSNNVNFLSNVNAADHKLIQHVSLYDGDFGMVKIMPTNFNGIVSDAGLGTAQSKARGYLLDPSLIEIAEFLPTKRVENPDLGGGRRGFVESMLTLIVKNPLGLGKFAATS